MQCGQSRLQLLSEKQSCRLRKLRRQLRNSVKPRLHRLHWRSVALLSR